MNSCDTMAVASGSLSTRTPLQSKMTTGLPDALGLAAKCLVLQTNQLRESIEGARMPRKFGRLHAGELCTRSEANSGENGGRAAARLACDANRLG